MIRSSKLTIKYSNKNKLDKIKLFIEEYKSIMNQCIELTWDMDKIPALAPKELTEKIVTNLSSRIIQCACKQAIAIVKGTKKKNEQRQYIINKLLENNFKKKARLLEKRLIKTTKPNLDNVNPELDSRFVKFDFNNKTSFDGWIILSSLGNELKIKIPIKRTKHFNEMGGKMKLGLRLSNKEVTIMFEKDVENNKSDKIVGLDIGINNVATMSDNKITTDDKHGWNLNKIINKMNKKKKGSKGYLRCQRHRTNFINWSINQLNLNEVGILRLEKIKDIKRNVRVSKFLNHWTYTEIKSKIEQTCEKFGVQIEYVSPTYTSQRCNSCGWVRNTNRKGKLFKCGSCGYTCDSDLNGAKNICVNLRPIGTKERLLHKNKTGFYWNVIEQENIVPVAQTNIFL